MENVNQEKCSCEKTDVTYQEEIESSGESPKDKRSRISLPSLGFNLPRARPLRFTSKRNNKKPNSNESSSSSPCLASTSSTNVKKSPKWGLKFHYAKKKSKITSVPTEDITQTCCKCTCYKKSEETEKVEEVSASTSGGSISSDASSSAERTTTENTSSSSWVPAPAQPIDEREVEIRQENTRAEDRLQFGSSNNIVISAPLVEHWIRTIHEDCDEAARLARAREIEQGVEAPANFKPLKRVQLVCSEEPDSGPRRLLLCQSNLSVDSLRALLQNNFTLKSCAPEPNPVCHTQVDFIHCLVPDLLDITNCSFYWGKMDRYEAERLLEGKPEGTFLLRDSAQEEFLFSVSFRKYGRSLHARIEQWNHKFSFDSHDPGVYVSNTVCGLIEHYKDPTSCMFFEPMLTCPLHRNFTFSLQHLCRAVIVNRLTYDNINHLQLPKTLKTYLKEYHYRQKVRVKKFDNDDEVEWFELSKMPP